MELTIHEHDWRLTLNIAEGHKPAFTWTSATAVPLADCVTAEPAQGARTAFATPAASAWRRWRACGQPSRRAGRAGRGDQHRPSGPRAGRPAPMCCSTALTRHQAQFIRRRRQRPRCASLVGTAYADAIVLDPPKFAPTAAHADRAACARDINRLALQLLEPGGAAHLLVLAARWSCSTRSWHPAQARTRAWDRAIPGTPGAAPDHR